MAATTGAYIGSFRLGGALKPASLALITVT